MTAEKGIEPGHTYVRLVGGPADGQLLDITDWSEALRGKGAILLDPPGGRYMEFYGPTGQASGCWHWTGSAL